MPATPVPGTTVSRPAQTEHTLDLSRLTGVTLYEPEVLGGFLAQMGVPEADLSRLDVPFPFDVAAFLSNPDALRDAFEMVNAKRNLLAVRHAMRADAQALRAHIESDLSN